MATNSHNNSPETFRQKFLRLVYPIVIKLSKKSKNGTILFNHSGKTAPTSFYELQVTLNNNQSLDFKTFKGKKVILVNTASNCGYTGQYSELQQLHERRKEDLIIIAFPANDFKEQEKGNDKEIAEFCQINYGVTFPLAKKCIVTKQADQNAVFRWLSEKALNGWCDHAPDWNFGKYIINEEGQLTHYFGPSISPLEENFQKALI